MPRADFQGDLIDPATGRRLHWRTPAWFGSAALASATEVAPTALDTPDPAPAPTGVWTEAGYLAPGTFT